MGWTLVNGSGVCVRKVTKILFAGWLAVQLTGGYPQRHLPSFAEEGDSPALAASQSPGALEERRPLPEAQITLPQYFGLYAVDQGKTITFPEDTSAPTDDRFIFSKDVEFLYFMSRYIYRFEKERKLFTKL